MGRRTATEPAWVGSTDLKECPDSPILEKETDEWRITRTYEGPFTTCNQGKNNPNPGSRVRGWGGWVYVKNTRVQKMPGGKGKLTIVAIKRSLSTTDPKEEPKDEPDTPADADNTDDAGNQYENETPIIEIDWIRTDKPLATHSIFADLTDAEWGNIKSWESIEKDSPQKYATFTYTTAGGAEAGLAGGALTYAKKIRRGIDSYTVYSPVHRSTRYYGGKPQTGGCGERGSPEGGGIEGYEYVKTADRATRQEGKWTRQQEWTGAEELDEDLYP